ncbi:MAG: metal-dependent hydrolase [Janthinobacterium lividum]
MDLLTHGIMGATLAQCGFQKSLGRKVILWGALAAMLPDIDVLVGTFAGPFADFKYHRWITHSFWFGPVIGSGLGYLLWRLEERRQSLKLWIFFFILTLITHPLLDLLTSFGTQLFAPFSDVRCSLDIISIVDLRYTGPLLVALILGFIFKKRENIVTGISLGAFGLSCAYLVYAVDLHRQSMDQAHQDWHHQHPHDSYVSLRSFPTLFQSYLRHLVIRYRDQICVGAQRVPNDGDRSIRWHCATQLPNACAIKLIGTPMGQRFAWFADDNYRAEVLSNNMIRFHDLRYPVFDRPLDGMWGIEGQCIPELQLRHFRHKIPITQQTLKNIGSYWQGELREIQ